MTAGLRRATPCPCYRLFFILPGPTVELSGARWVQFYRISGLNVASDIALPGLIEGRTGAPAEVTIRRGQVPDRLDDVSASGPTWQAGPRRFLLHIPGIAHFLLADGREIVFAPASEESMSDIPIFLVGTVFGILLHQRGQIVLHASAVQVDGRAVLFCGSSGAGKSTLAAAFAQRGYALVTDDLCSISLGAHGGPIVHPDGRHLKLWAQAIERLDLNETRGERVRPKLQKYYVAPERVLTEPLPLGAIYVLREARAPHAPGIERQNIVDAALALRRNAYRPLLIRRLNQREDYFRAAAALTHVAGVSYLTRAFDFAKMPEVIAWLEAHWRELGLKEKAA